VTVVPAFSGQIAALEYVSGEVLNGAESCAVLEFSSKFFESNAQIFEYNQ
jgi:hypothetical protein